MNIKGKTSKKNNEHEQSKWMLMCEMLHLARGCPKHSKLSTSIDEWERKATHLGARCLLRAMKSQEFQQMIFV